MQDEQTNAWESYRPTLSSPSEVVTVLNKTEKYENKEQDKTRRETHRSKNTKPHIIRITLGPPS